MTEIAATPGRALVETLDTVRTGMVPATVGAVGAAAGLLSLPFVFVVASMPMSLLGLGLALHTRTPMAALLGAAGVVLAAYGLAVG